MGVFLKRVHQDFSVFVFEFQLMLDFEETDVGQDGQNFGSRKISGVDAEWESFFW